MTYEIAGATRHTVEMPDGVSLSVHEVGASADPDRPVVVFSHGFPELAYSWRHQLAALSAAGYRAIAPDQRGYGASSRPTEITDYDIHHLTGDLVALLDHFGIDRAVFVGHDWGGFVVWQMPLLHPDRVAGVVGVNTPYLPRMPMLPTEVFKMVGGEGNYIIEFQAPGVADEILARDVHGLFDALFRSPSSPEHLAELAASAAEAVGETATTFERIIAAPRTGTPLLSTDEMAVYVDTFTETGFTGGLNWYRNFDRNWELTPELDGAHIDGIPCMMVTASWDPVLTPALAQSMPSVVGDLEMHELAECGHWTPTERADELDHLLVDFLGRRF